MAVQEFVAQGGSVGTLKFALEEVSERIWKILNLALNLVVMTY